MTFEEYVIEEITNQDLYEDLEIEDNSIVYDYDIDYTTQDWFFVPLFYLTMTKSVMLSLLNRATNGNELLAVLDGFSDTNPVNQHMELMTEMYDKMKSAQPTLETIEFWSSCDSLASVHYSPHWALADAILTQSTQKHIMWEEIQDMPGEIFDLDDWGHPMAECWHDMELNQTEDDDAWHLHICWWWYHSPRTSWYHLHCHYHCNCFHSLL